MAVLLPEGKQSFITNKGLPLVGGRVYTYAAGTSTPKETYANAAGTTANTNPVILDTRGEATIFWDGSYKVILKDASDNVLWTEDGVAGADVAVTQLREDLANTVSATKGAGLVGYDSDNDYAAATVGFKLQEWLSVLDKGAVGNAVANDTTAIQAAVTEGVAQRKIVVIPAGEYKITAPISITGPVAIVGQGRGITRILAVGCDAFTVSAGVAHVTISDMTIADSSRYTVTPNTDTAISVNGTTASQCYWHNYRNLFIDGFEVGIYAGGVCSTSFSNVTTVYTHQSVDFQQQCLNNTISQCYFGEQDSGGVVPAAGSFGIRVGDGTINCEGLAISQCLIFGVHRGLWVRASINCTLQNSIIDMAHEFGILAAGTAGAPCINNTFTTSYIGMIGSAGDSAIFLANGNATGDAQNRGTVVRDMEMLAYPGATANYGILCSGAEEERNTISGNRCQNFAVADCRVEAGSGHRLSDNIWRSTTGFSGTVPVKYGSTNVGAVSGPGLTYSTSMTPDLSVFQTQVITATNGTAFTINAPTNDSLRNEVDWEVTLVIRNTSGGALGAVTWNSIYKLATWTQPANGFSRSITFRWNGSNYVEFSRTPADVPN
jgi:hypothetical protein